MQIAADFFRGYIAGINRRFRVVLPLKPRHPYFSGVQQVNIGEIMLESKIKVPAELRDLAEKTIDQAEKAFGMFFDAAGKSMTSMPGPGWEISKKALSFSEQNMKAAFDHTRKLAQAQPLSPASKFIMTCTPQSRSGAAWIARKVCGHRS